MTAHALAPPFSETQWRRIHTLLEELDDQQALWLSGYLPLRAAFRLYLPHYK